jgi:hypothetical protein
MVRTSAIQRREGRLLVEPDILHAPAAENAVDRDRQPFHLRLPTRRTAVVKNYRVGAVLRQPFSQYS